MSEYGSVHQRIEEARSRTASLAHHLSVIAIRQSEKAITGALAAPVAITLGAAASALYITALLERGFESLETSIIEMARHMMRGSGGRQSELSEGQYGREQHAQRSWREQPGQEWRGKDSWQGRHFQEWRGKDSWQGRSQEERQEEMRGQEPSQARSWLEQRAEEQQAQRHAQWQAKEQIAQAQLAKEQIAKEQHAKEQHAKEQHAQAQQAKEQHAKEQSKERG